MCVDIFLSMVANAEFICYHGWRGVFCEGDYFRLMIRLCGGVYCYLCLLNLICEGVYFYLWLLNIVCDGVYFYLYWLILLCEGVYIYLCLLDTVCEGIYLNPCLLNLWCDRVYFWFSSNLLGEWVTFYAGLQVISGGYIFTFVR